MNPAQGGKGNARESHAVGERRRRRLAERQAQLRAQQLAGRAQQDGSDDDPEQRTPPAPSTLPVTRRERREAELRLAGAQAEQQEAEQPEPWTTPDPEPERDPDPEPDPAPEQPQRARRPHRRTVVRPPSATMRTSGPATGEIPAVRARERRGERRAAGTAPATSGQRGDVVPVRAAAPRRRWWLLAAVVAALVAVAAIAIWLIGRGDDGGSGATEGQPPSQRTVLLALADEERDVLGAALLGTDGKQSSALLVPSQLLVDVAGGGRVPVRDFLDTGDSAPGQALEDLLDVRVDGTWVLSTQGLAGLVDGLGGIVVDVTTSVTSGQVAVPQGQGQKLTGAQAVAYATYLGRGEPEPVRAARTSQVLTGLLGAMPDSAGEVGTRLDALGATSRSTLSTPDLAARLADLVKTQRAGDLGATVLPVKEISAGGDQTIYGLDAAEAASVVESRFAGAQRPGGEDVVRVLVQNGVGTPGLGEQARDRLVDAGMRFVSGGNAATLGREKTVVAIPSDGQRDRERAAAVAKALGLPDDVIAVGKDQPTLADVVVVLGEDFAAKVSSTTPAGATTSP